MRGVWSSSRRTTGRKPRSAMWSASSSTVTCTASSFACPVATWSARRPGQATSTSTPALRPVICGPGRTPPNTVRVRSDRASASGFIAAWIWVTSSRVGARISARGRPGRRSVSPAASRVSRGSRKAYVLPEPVRPRPSTSRPARESGRVAAWMGNGAPIPRAASTSARTLGTPSSANVGPTAGTAVTTVFGTIGRVAVAVRGVDVAVELSIDAAGIDALWGRRAAMDSPNVEGSSCPARTVRSRRVVVDWSTARGRTARAVTHSIGDARRAGAAEHDLVARK